MAQPEDFLPQRWLVPEEHPLYPPKNVWRPFERELRNRIGQEVALTESKVMLVLTIREFDVRDPYEELKGNPASWEVNGQRAYMIRRGGGMRQIFILVKSALSRAGTRRM